MEPRSFKRGNLHSVGMHARICVASMEPRSFKRGNASSASSLTISRSGFNGATFFQTWKRPLERAQFTTKPLLQWSHVLSNVETSRLTVRVQRVAAASMEPRSFKRGNPFGPKRKRWPQAVLQWSHVLSNVETSRGAAGSRRDKRFNGATFFQTWKRLRLAATRERVL